MAGCENADNRTVKNSAINISCTVTDSLGISKSSFSSGEHIVVEYKVSNLSADTLFYNPTVSDIDRHTEWLSIVRTSDTDTVAIPRGTLLTDAPQCASIPPYSDLTVSYFYPDDFLSPTGKDVPPLAPGEYRISFTPIFLFYDSDCGSTAHTLETRNISITFTVS